MTLNEDDIPAPMTIGQLKQIRREVALRCAEIANAHPPFLNDGIDGKLIATRIRREFGLEAQPESDGPPLPDREVQLGVIEFHSSKVNPGLIERFYAMRDDLTQAACIVDIWLIGIATVLREFGYDMRVYRTPGKQKQWEDRRRK